MNPLWFYDEAGATTFELLIGTADMGKEKAENFLNIQGTEMDKLRSSDVQTPIITREMH
jgi:hypothetical protein